ncbi:alginate lyase family protein [Streptomyces sp. PA03-3a]|nr:alginate lyase family protein [Streptomyces sp. PA03-3a]
MEPCPVRVHKQKGKGHAHPWGHSRRRRAGVLAVLDGKDLLRANARLRDGDPRARRACGTSWSGGRPVGAGSLDGRGQGPCPARRRSRTTTSARPPYGWPSRPSALTTRRVAVGAAGRGAQRARAHAEHAARILRTWFVDPATRTNPEPGNAQAIPCRYDGRAIGIIDLSQGLRRPARGRPPLDRTGPRRHAGLGGRVPRLAGGRRLRQAEGFRRQQPRRLPPHASRPPAAGTTRP